MVPNESLRTHMSFDGICDVFGTLGFELVAREVEGRQRPIGDYLRRQHDRPISAHLLAAHVELCLVALVATERLQCCMLLEDGGKVLCLLSANVVAKDVNGDDRRIITKNRGH